MTTKWLVIPDTHIPIHDKRKVSVLFEVIKRWKPDHITHLGDLDDMASPSRWATGTKEEVEQRLIVNNHDVRQFWYDVRRAAPNARLDWRLGNHEDRIFKYVATKAKSLEGFITPELLWPVKELGIAYSHYGDAPTRMYGTGNRAWYVCHGSYISKHAGQSGKAEQEAYGVNGISGHTHRLATYHKTDLSGTYTWVEAGHLTDVTKMGYTAAPNWQAGFVYCHVERDKVYPFEARFDGHTTFVDGRKYVG
jgi:predicted phosphodiesterase